MLPKNFYRYLHLSVLLSFILFAPALLTAQSYIGSPVTKPRLIRVVQAKDVAVPIIVKLIKEHGVNFKVTPQVEQELVAAKANRQIIEAAKNNYRAQAVADTSLANTATNRTSAANRKVSTNVAKVEDTDSKYDELYYQGQQLASRLSSATSREQIYTIAQSLKSIGNQGIKLDPSRFEAYKFVGFSAMLTGDFNEAERYGQMAIDRGGSLNFLVYHLTPGYQPHLDILHVGKGLISIENYQGKYFPYYNREVTGFQVHPTTYNYNGANVAVFSVAVYKDNAPVRYDFVPAITSSTQEANLITRLIRANIYR